MGDFSILCDRLPDSVTVNGRVCPILTDFRRWILMLDLFDECRESSDAPLDLITAAKCAIRIVSAEPDGLSDLPADSLAALLEALAVFASGGAEPASTDEHGDSVQVIDFSCDAELILSAFQSAYGIDLTREYVHWWRFLALLRALPADTDLMRVVSLRTCDTTKIGDDELRRRMRRAKAAVRIRQRTDGSPKRN